MELTESCGRRLETAAGFGEFAYRLLSAPNTRRISCVKGEMRRIIGLYYAFMRESGWNHGFNRPCFLISGDFLFSLRFIPKCKKQS